MTESDITFSAELPRFAPPPTNAAVSRIRDVIICTTGGSDVDADEYRAHPPPESPLVLRLEGAAEPVALGRGAVLGRLPNEESELVMNACSPRGHYFYPIRQFGQRYSFIREVEIARWQERPYAWDDCDVLWDCLSLSRLIRDNAFSTQYAGRIVDHADGQKQIIYTLAATSKHVYRFRRDRDWLDPDEASELRKLAHSYWSCADDLPPRLRRAMWRTEYSCWLQWADLALPVIVSGLESLLKTERYRATSQFTGRVPGLAAELGLDGITPALCEGVYDARSEWLHGTHVRLFGSGMEQQEEQQAVGSHQPRTREERDALATVALCQGLLRGAVRRSLEDPAFREIFADEDAIRERWPI